MVERTLLYGVSDTPDGDITFHKVSNVNFAAYRELEYLSTYVDDAYVERHFRCFLYDWAEGWGIDFTPQDELSGELLSATYSLSNNRGGPTRSFNFTLAVDDTTLAAVKRFNQVAWFLIGIRSNNTDGQIIWFSAGFGCIDKPSFKIDASNKSVSFSAKDLLCLLDGSKAGTFPTNGSSAWSYKQDKTVRENIINTLLEAEDVDGSWGGIGINFNIDSDDFDESQDLLYEDGALQYVEVKITNDLELDVGSSIYDGINQVLQNSAQYYQFYFRSDGHIAYERTPEGDAEYNTAQYVIDENEIISYDASIDYTDIGNSIQVFGYVRDVCCVKDSKYSGELICDGEEHTHSTTGDTIETGFTYNDSTGVLTIKTFCDRMPCTLEDFNYTGDTTYGANTLYLPSDYSPTSYVLYINNVQLPVADPTDDIYANPSDYYDYDDEVSMVHVPVNGDTNILSYDRWGELDAFTYKFVFKGILQPKYEVQMYKGDYGINECGRVCKFFQEDAYDTVAKCRNRGLYELYCAINPTRTVQITTRPMYWLQPNQVVYLQKGVNDYENFDDEESDYYVITSISVNNNTMSISMESYIPFAKFLQEWGKYLSSGGEEFNE